MINFNMTKEKQNCNISFIQFLRNRLYSVSSLNQSLRIIVLFTNHKGLSKELLNNWNAVIFNDIMLAIYNKRNTPKIFINDVLAKSEKIITNFAQILRLNTSPELNDKKEICLMNQHFGQFRLQLYLAIDVIVQLINRTDLHFKLPFILLILHA